jgi:hypothetical protein
MGADSVGVFENDDAMDFLAEVEDATEPGQRWDLVRQALSDLAAETDWPEAPTVSTAIAAMALVASATRPDLLGGATSAPDWWPDSTAGPVPTDVLALARQVPARIREPNEWLELWTEAGGEQAALNEVDRYSAAL